MVDPGFRVDFDSDIRVLIGRVRIVSSGGRTLVIPLELGCCDGNPVPDMELSFLTFGNSQLGLGQQFGFTGIFYEVQCDGGNRNVPVVMSDLSNVSDGDRVALFSGVIPQVE